MEIIDEISFCSFFEIVELEDSKQKNPKEENSHTIHLNSTEQNERLMILYSKAS